MRKFGLIGYPLGHSFSQKYFSEKFSKEDIGDCIYENFPIRSIEEFPVLIQKEPDLCGLNVTIPYKSQVLRYVDQTDDAVKDIGAANVLKIKRINGRTIVSAHNSDITGIKASIDQFNLTEIINALILGTGGSSKAVAWTLTQMGISYRFVSRNPGEGRLTYDSLSKELIRNSDLIINTTPLGMFPDVNSLPEINYNLLGEKQILFDLVYNPEKTRFLKSGEERGCRIINGLKMLRVQADRSWEIWNDNSL